MHLTLIVPELLWPEPDDRQTFDALQAPGLAWLFARAELTQHARMPFETALCGAFPGAPGLAALRRLGDGHDDARSGHWLCADPVHLRFHHERIVLADAGAFDVDASETQALLADLNTTFADIGAFHFGDARRCYLRLHQAVDHAVQPLSAVAGRRIDGALPTGDATLTRWLNEVQMFLHGHPVNSERQAVGKPAINSLWLWGGGSLPQQLASPFSAVLARDPIALGLARLSATPAPAMPAHFNPKADLGPNPLIVLDDLLAPVLYENGGDWRSRCDALDQAWFTPLQKCLCRQVDRLDIIAPTVYGCLRLSLSGSARWTFWKSPRPLADTARHLAENATA